MQMQFSDTCVLETTYVSPIACVHEPMNLEASEMYSKHACLEMRGTKMLLNYCGLDILQTSYAGLASLLFYEEMCVFLMPSWKLGERRGA